LAKNIQVRENKKKTQKYVCVYGCEGETGLDTWWTNSRRYTETSLPDN